MKMYVFFFVGANLHSSTLKDKRKSWLYTIQKMFIPLKNGLEESSEASLFIALIYTAGLVRILSTVLQSRARNFKICY
jgi:hypothetical protein